MTYIIIYIWIFAVSGMGEGEEWIAGGESGRWAGCREDGSRKVRKKSGLEVRRGDFCSACTCKPLDRA